MQECKTKRIINHIKRNNNETSSKISQKNKTQNNFFFSCKTQNEKHKKVHENDAKIWQF